MVAIASGIRIVPGKILLALCLVAVLFLPPPAFSLPPEALEVEEKEHAAPELTYFHRLSMFDNLEGIPLGPLDDGWDEMWGSSVSLQEEIRLEEIAREMENTAYFRTHIVQEGETLWDISRKYGINVATLAGANHHVDNVHRIRPGQELKVLNMHGTVHVVQEGETISDLSQRYEVSVEKILQTNWGLDPDSIAAGDEVVIPGAQPLDFADRGGSLDSFVWPVQGGYISSRYGPRWGGFHHGIDIAVSTGTPVVAAKCGRVVFSGWYGSYGNVVDIDHGSGVMTRYAHNQTLLVRRGQFVYQGQVIAYSGNTGRSTGPHLHFEIHHNDRTVNPIHYLPPRR